MLSKICQSCGNVFYKKESESKKYWETKKYCSYRCSLKFTSVKRFGGNPGRIVSQETKDKIRKSCKGRLANDGSFKKGSVPWTKGKKFPEFSGENHPGWKPKTITNCLFCNKEISLAPWEIKSGKKYCSPQCDKNHRKKIRIGRDTVICEICGRTFIGTIPGCRFCSKECQGKYLAVKYKGRPSMNPGMIHKKGKDSPLYKERIERECKVCHKIFLVRRSDISITLGEPNPASYCSRKCFGLDRRGASSPVWKGGLLSETQYLRQKLHAMPEYKEWRQKVFKRDYGTCVKCGTIGDIECHHIKHVSLIIKENNLTTTEQARECKELWDPANGQTLCKRCHRKTDSYGRQTIKDN